VALVGGEDCKTKVSPFDPISLFDVVNKYSAHIAFDPIPKQTSSRDSVQMCRNH
jgi:hypothetical protein